ncbi:hypothetical protein [Streptomyces beijiangensis]|uniref:hypothetical protein n=1 Tax=Streptomyces beijiangensis TaxID=163361 RepID=UPI001F5CDA47|nr:hypothetical protein [Streptomyces beijiangensis]
MSEISALIDAHWPFAPSAETDWLLELADGSIEPEMVAGFDLGEVTTSTGGGLGRDRHPGPGWRRLRWAELARRTGDPLVPEGLTPSCRCFPSSRKKGSWPLSIHPPTEGSLDRETWHQPIEVLIRHSQAGADTPCSAYYNPLTVGAVDFDNLHVRTGRLGDAHLLYDNPETDFSPSNLWPTNRSWVTGTDYDLWATKVVGPAPLIEALLGDPEMTMIAPSGRSGVGYAAYWLYAT